MHIMTDFELNLIVRCLAGEASDYEREKLEEWLCEEGNKIQYEELRAIWMASTGLHRTYSPDLERARAKIQNGISRAFKVNPWIWVGKAAAILIVAVGVIWSIAEYSAIRDIHGIAMQEIATGSTMDSVVLSDGSAVWLNRGTILKFPREFTGSERRVLLQGEAFFEVAHHAEKPFVIEAQGTITRVLGTSFNVKTSETDVLVAVRTGKVFFCQRDNTKNFTLLERDEMGAFSRSNGLIKKSTVDGTHIPSWRDRSLFFNNTPLPQVIDRLSAYYNTPIHLDPTIHGNLSLTTSFDDQTVEEVLEVVCATLDLRLKGTPDGYWLVGAGKHDQSKDKQIK
jgi:transmembrane sensor